MPEPDDPYPMNAPQDEQIPVLAAVIVRENKYLVCKRPAHKRHGGLWEFPGGKLEAGESWRHAAERELAEELALKVIDVGAPMFSVHDEGSPYVIVFVKVETEGDPHVLEHEELHWASDGDLTNLALAPSDRVFAEWLTVRSARQSS